jgi:dTMP kinase
MAFIVFEGLDGAGKSSLIETLKKKLEDQKLDYIFTREPGGTPLAEELRNIILRDEEDKEAPVSRCELLLYEAARAQHVEKVIRPALENKKWIICDRFTASTYAFQKGGRDLHTDDILWLNNFATSDVKPDLQILLDLPVEVSKQRMEKRVQETGVKKDRFEKEKQDFHQKVRDAYLEIAKSDEKNWIILDATKSPKEVQNDFLMALKERKLLV